MFDALETLPPDPILGLGVAFREDPSPDKVDLSIGVYRDSTGQTPVMAAVRDAERQLVDTQSTKAYLPPAGSPGFREAMFRLVMGDRAGDLRQRCGVIQTPGGCGALRLGAELAARAAPGTAIYLSEPTWPNHGPLLSGGGLRLERYPYYDPASRSLRAQAMIDELESVPAGSLVMLQASAHNPTGVDPDREQWKAILEVIAWRRLVPFFDIAYQGLVDGVDEDAWVIREAARRLPELLVAASCSKSFGLYRERTGALIVMGTDTDRARAIESHVNKAARCMYSMPPAHGGLIAERILADAALTAQWRAELAVMAARIRALRAALAREIGRVRPGQDTAWLAVQRGMFSLLGLPPEAVRALREQHHVFMGGDSRMNIAGLGEDRIAHVARLIAPHLP